MSLLRFAFVASLLTLAGCVTPLQPDNYQDKITVARLADNQFRVDPSRWSLSDDDTAADLALLRSAEVTLQNGYHYFVVVDGDSAVDVALAEPPAPGVEYLVQDGLRYRLVAPGHSNRIICLRENPAANGYVALFVKASLRAKYAMDLTGSAI